MKKIDAIKLIRKELKKPLNIKRDWVEEFDRLKPHTLKCHIWDSIENKKKGINSDSHSNR